MEFANSLQSGTRIGPYRVIGPLGTGATATVYECVDAHGNTYAVKVRKRGVITADRRFVREFEALRSLRLPGVVRVFEVGLDETLLWFSMEAVRGKTLLEHIHQTQSLPKRLEITLDFGQQLLHILASLHNAGFVHRDIKPSNVLVDTEGNLKVLDFGISRYFDSVTDYTDPGVVVGTMPYMAPEQFAGLPVTPRIDVFAAGLILYEAINGLRPSPKSPLGWIPLTTLEKLQPLATLHQCVPRSLSHLIDRMLHVIPQKRPSADEAASELADLDLHADEGDWPEPIWTDTGNWWTPVEGVYGSGSRNRICILEGPAGSGRHRVAEQIHRHALLQGVWTLHGTCDIATVGGPFIEIIHQLLRDGEDEDWCQSILGMDGALLTTLWPDLPIQSTLSAVDDSQPTIEDIASAVGLTLHRAATLKRIVLIIDQFEQVDSITAATVHWLLKNQSERFGLLLIHDDRWSSVLSHSLTNTIEKTEAGIVLRIPPLKPHMTDAIVRSLCPNGSPDRFETTSSLKAVEAGHKQLAKWRKEKYTTPPLELWPFAVTTRPIPTEVFEALCGSERPISRWLKTESQGVTLQQQSAYLSARNRLGDLRRSARLLVEKYREFEPEDEHIEHIARLQLLAGDTSGAWPLVLQSALTAHAKGRYTIARQWLMLLETLPFPKDFPQEKAFSLTMARARVALFTEQQAPRKALLDHCDRLAQSAVEVQSVGVLLAEHHIRKGDVRSGLVTALRCASPSVGPDPQVAVKALGVATRCRLILNQPMDARIQVNRAHTILEKHPNPALASEILELDARISVIENEYAVARDLAERARGIARQEDNLWSQACSAQISSEVQRLLGNRRAAEREIRFARNALGQCGDMTLLTMAYLQYATLLVERGDIIGARKYFNRSIRRVRRIGLPHARPLVMKLQLDVATAMSQPNEAEEAIAFFKASAQKHEEAPATVVRYWRSRGEFSRAMTVSPPSQNEGWGKLLWRLERAIAALNYGDHNTAAMELHAASLHSNRHLFSELDCYFELLSVFTQNRPNHEWRRIMTKASASLYLPLVMSALELNARRFENAGQHTLAMTQWDTLYARAEELGYRPAVELARDRLTPKTR